MSTTEQQQQGQADAQAGKGQRDPSSFKSDDERKAYQAGYNNEKGKK